MKATYLDQLIENKHRTSVWRAVSAISMVLNGIFSIAILVLAVNLVKASDKVQYILVPGIPEFTVVRPGEIPDSYIEQGFRTVTNYLNGWTYETIKDNYKFLFERLYSHELINRTRANLNSQKLFERVENEKIVSLWNIVPEESEYHWCGKVQIANSSRGVACGIVTGYQTVYENNNIPRGKEKISYLIYATSVMPSPSNPFAVQFNRIKRGPFNTLKSELERSIDQGILPPEDSDVY